MSGWHLMAEKSIYGVHPGVTMIRNVIASLPEKTGRSLGDWFAFITHHGPNGEAARREWLKKEHKLGTNYAVWLAERAEGKGETSDPDEYLKVAARYVEEMFTGAKAGLRPTYDRLLKVGLSAGKDVKACPCRTIVPIYRNHVIAQIKPATRTRIDFGLALGATKTPKRLIDTGGFKRGDRITHRIEITSPADIDDEVKRWLKKAYEMDA
jgi:hypothetical protein